MAPRGPASITWEQNGTGSASFRYPEVIDLVADRCREEIEHALRRQVELLGVSFVDAVGRDVDGPICDGVTLVGFRVRPCDGCDPATPDIEGRPHDPHSSTPRP